MDKQSKIYIAGHRGLVGSAIHRHLKSLGYVHIITRTSRELDLRDAVATEEFFRLEKPEYVFMAAAKVGGIMANNTYRADFIYENLQIQNNVVYASYKFNVKKLLFLGSSCIYPKDAPQPLTENSLLTGELEYTNEPYAVAKIAGIKLIESFNIQYGTNYLAVMPTNLYGHNDNFDLERAHVMPALIRKLQICKFLEDGNLDAVINNLGLPEITSRSELIEIISQYGISLDGESVRLGVWGTGTPKREFLHSDDMAAACIHIMNNVNFSGVSEGLTEVRNTHINIGTGSDISISDLANMIKEIIGFKGTITFDSSKPDGTMRKLMNVDKLGKLGWTYSISLEDGLKRTIAWYQEQQTNA